MDQEASRAQGAFEALCGILFPEQMTRRGETAEDEAASKKKNNMLNANSFIANGHIGFYGFGNDPFIIGLHQLDREHKCLVVGTVRPELMLEMVWERILSSEGRITPHELDTRRLLVSIDTFLFDITYRALTANLNFGDIEHWNKLRHCRDTHYSSFDDCYRFLCNWADKRGILKTTLQPEGLTATMISKMLMDTYDGSQVSDELVFYTLKAFFKLHAKQYASWPGPSVIEWEFLQMHELFQRQETPNLTFLDQHIGPLAMESMLICPRYLFNIYVTTLSSSERECGLAIERLEEVIRKSLKETTVAMAAEQTGPILSEKAHIRCWPFRMVPYEATTHDIPYEGCYRLAVVQRESTQSKTSKRSTSSGYDPKPVVELFISKINNLMASNSAVSVSAEIVGTPNKHFRKCPKQWPMKIAAPPSDIRLEKLTPAAPAGKKDFPPTEPPPSSQAQTAFLRPAADVLNRLRYDDSYNLDDFVVGYEDRHAGLMEKPAADWITESTSDQFIPQSRIVYFRNTKTAVDDNEDGRVWDRRGKRDLVFGTGLES